MLKNKINSIFKKFGFEIHGLGYLKKISKNSLENDAFEVQREILKDREVKVIFDVGASRGDVTQTYANLFPKAEIFAFEPFPEAANAFKERFDKIPAIHLHNLAISDKSGIATFHVNKSVDTSSLLASQKLGASSDKSCETVTTVQVKTENIETICSELNIAHIDILKMDVQGSELAILKGAKNTLGHGKISIIYSEVYFKPQYVGQPLFYDIATFLKSYGYELQDLYDPYYNASQILWADALFVKNDLL